MSEVQHKTCVACGAAKPIDEFHVHAGSADGRRKQCRVCRSAAVKAKRNEAPERQALTRMIQRCHNPNNPRYPYYGGRGIYVCAGWRDDPNSFVVDMGLKPSPKHEVDRKDNDKGYTCGHCADCVSKGAKANCRWATRSEQMRNTRRTRKLTANGETKTLDDWATSTGIQKGTLENRLRTQKLDDETAITKPVIRADITIDGVTKRRSEWARESGTPAGLIRDRMRAGWSAKEAVLTPPGSSRRAA